MKPLGAILAAATATGASAMAFAQSEEATSGEAALPSLPMPANGLRDLCIRFSGDTRPAMWVLDRITLLPSTTE